LKQSTLHESREILIVIINSTVFFIHERKIEKMFFFLIWNFIF